jgi:pSer/pThr/pTyr-binding forkhead associated (FHA) protein
LTIGRADSCEIRVDVPGVDDEHAKISEVALIALGTDCAIGDVPLDPGARRLVMPGDEIQIGSVVLALEGDDPSLAQASPDAQITQRLVPPALEGPRVRVVEGTTFGDELLLKEEGREYVVGRGAKCDLVLDDREVSREHIKVVRRGYVVHIVDLSSTRGSWLGRSNVYTGATVEWTRPRMLRIGSTVLSLDLPESVRKAAPAAQASAPMTATPRSRNNVNDLHATPSGAPVSRRSGGPPPASSQPAPGVAMAPGPHALAAFVGPATTQPMPQPMPPSGPGFAPGPVSSSPRSLGSLPPPQQARTAWKKTGPTIGKASGLLLLALAGLLILGGILVVFTLLE